MIKNFKLYLPFNCLSILITNRPKISEIAKLKPKYHLTFFSLKPSDLTCKTYTKYFCKSSSKTIYIIWRTKVWKNNLKSEEYEKSFLDLTSFKLRGLILFPNPICYRHRRRSSSHRYSFYWFWFWFLNLQLISESSIAMDGERSVDRSATIIVEDLQGIGKDFTGFDVAFWIVNRHGGDDWNRRQSFFFSFS